MIGVVDENVYALYVDALSNAFDRKGQTSFISQVSAENIVRRKIMNN